MLRITHNGRVTDWPAAGSLYRHCNTVAEHNMLTHSCGEPFRPIRFVEAMQWSAAEELLHPEDAEVLIRSFQST